MRQPTFSRSRRHSRGYRLARTGIAVAALIVVAALVANLFGGGAEEEELPLPQVSFSGPAGADADTRRVAAQDIAEEKQDIIDLLNEWFQKGFVDPAAFEEGDFSDVRDLFHKEAQAEFDKQVTTLTIGEARAEVERVEPQAATTNMWMYFDKGKAPMFATVRVTFSARATLKEEKTLPLRIVVSGLFTMEKTGGDWRVKYWSNAKQTQNSIQPSPTPTT